MKHQEWCPACDDLSDTIYRCDNCGYDLAGKDKSTAGREQL